MTMVPVEICLRVSQLKLCGIALPYHPACITIPLISSLAALQPHILDLTWGVGAVPTTRSGENG